MIRQMGLIKVGSHVDLDFDHQFIPAHKFDTKYSYKQNFGYFPGWASIGGIIVGGDIAFLIAKLNAFPFFQLSEVLIATATVGCTYIERVAARLYGLDDFL